MKKNLCLLILICSIAFLMSACQNKSINYEEHLDEYVDESLTYSENFTVLQLTDLHWSLGTSNIKQQKYITNLLSEVESHTGKKVDLIVLTGDLFMLSNVKTVKSLIKFLEGLDIPYAPLWGNHDRQGLYNANWLSKQFLNAKNCLYKEVDNDNVYGRSNYVINLKSSTEDKVAWQIAILDSGADYSETGVGLSITYDYIREDQAKWFEKEHKEAGEDVPVIAYYHIAQYESYLAELDVKNGANYKNKYFNYEGVCGSKAEGAIENLTWFETAKANNVKAMFQGHAHSTDWTVDYQGITLGLGVKTGTELYYAKVSKEDALAQGISVTSDFDLIGASLVTLHSDNTFNLEHLYYNEGKEAIWLGY